jgi:hypothetical protein
MKPTEVIETLIRVGSLIRVTAGGSGKNWADFLDSSEFKEIAGAVKELIGRLSETDLSQAIERIKAQQTELLGGQTIRELPAERLFSYMDLADARTVLAARNVEIAVKRDFFAWLVDDALPVLLRVGPVIIPLLL